MCVCVYVRDFAHELSHNYTLACRENNKYIENLHTGQ